MSNAIRDVLDAEREAEAILAKAQQTSEGQMLEAKQKAMQQFEAGKVRIDAEMDAKFQQQRAKLEAERAAIIADAQQQAAQLERTVRAKLPRVTEALLKKFTSVR